MANRVFFSFHYQDVIDFRANVVRNHWLTKPDREVAGFFDASLWEASKKTGGDPALKKLINEGLENTSNTCILVGTETWMRPWVRYEILKSFKRGNRQFGVNINGVKGRDGRTKFAGPNPFLHVGVTFSEDGRSATLWQKIGEQWFEYSMIDKGSTYSCTQVAAQYRGKGFNFSSFYKLYDWQTDDGFNNFSSWLR